MSRRRLRFAGLLALVAGALAFTRLLVLNVQMGDAATLFDPDLTTLGWMALGPSSLAFAIGALAVVLGFALGQRIVLASGAIVMAAGFALTGHTQALTDPGLAPYAVALHAAIAGFCQHAGAALALLGLVYRNQEVGTVGLLLVVLSFLVADVHRPSPAPKLEIGLTVRRSHALRGHAPAIVTSSAPVGARAVGARARRPARARRGRAARWR